ncbi:MAG: hypothetical protein Q9195_008199 [Heterodermia aff. obscurata]
MDTLRSALQPITHNLPTPLYTFGNNLLGPQCYKTIILDLTLTDAPCIKLAISKALGLAIISFSSIVKIPQILKLLQSQSASGVSFLAYMLETGGFVATLAYNARQGFPFSTYGETALIALQNVVICVLVLRYQGRSGVAGGVVAGLAAVLWGLMDERVVSGGALGYVQAVAGNLAVASKMPQIWTVWRQGGTGQLSAFAVFTYVLGSLARVFTTLQEVDDKLILYSFVAGCVLNVVLAGQMVYYWKSPATAGHAAEIGKKPEKIAMGSSTGASTKGKGPTTRRRG